MKYRVLIIEDDAAQRQLFKIALEDAGYEVLEAPDGVVGLQLYHQYGCDVIITDIFMPKEDGIETIFELKAEGAKVKIIAISGGGSWSQYSSRFGADNPLDIAKRFGADRILKKPIKIRQLLPMLNDLLPKKEQARSLDEIDKKAAEGNRKKRILVIEDDEAQRRLFKTALQQANYDVLDAPNGRVGLQLYEQQACDLVLTDIFMPEKEGLETIFELKKHSPSPRIIAISGGGRWAQHGRSLRADEPLDIAKRFGADRILKKPVKIRQLLITVNVLLSR